VHPQSRDRKGAVRQSKLFALRLRSGLLAAPKPLNRNIWPA